MRPRKHHVRVRGRAGVRGARVPPHSRRERAERVRQRRAGVRARRRARWRRAPRRRRRGDVGARPRRERLGARLGHVDVHEVAHGRGVGEAAQVVDELERRRAADARRGRRGRRGRRLGGGRRASSRRRAAAAAARPRSFPQRTRTGIQAHPLELHERRAQVVRGCVAVGAPRRVCGTAGVHGAAAELVGRRGTRLCVQRVCRRLRDNVPLGECDELQIGRGDVGRRRDKVQRRLDRELGTRHAACVRARQDHRAARVAHELHDRGPEARVVVKKHVDLVEEDERLPRRCALARDHVVARELPDGAHELLTRAPPEARVHLKHRIAELGGTRVHGRRLAAPRRALQQHAVRERRRGRRGSCPRRGRRRRAELVEPRLLLRVKLLAVHARPAALALCDARLHRPPARRIRRVRHTQLVQPVAQVRRRALVREHVRSAPRAPSVDPLRRRRVCTPRVGERRGRRGLQLRVHALERAGERAWVLRGTREVAGDVRERIARRRHAVVVRKRRLARDVCVAVDARGRRRRRA